MLEAHQVLTQQERKRRICSRGFKKGPEFKYFTDKGHKHHAESKVEINVSALPFCLPHCMPRTNTPTDTHIKLNIKGP